LAVESGGHMSDKTKSEVYGTVTVGEKGQVVIPARLREALNIKTGDKLIVFVKHEKICLIPTEQFNEFLNRTTEMLAKFKKIHNG